MPAVPIRQSSDYHKDPKFGRLLLVSLIIHGVVWMVFSGDWLGSSSRNKPPVYYVDLIHKPVLNPQAGRPEPRPAKKQQAAPVKRAVSTTKPTKKTVKKPASKPAAKPAPQVRATKEPTKNLGKEKKLQSALEEIRDRQARTAERDALKDKLAKLRDSVNAAATVPKDVPVGMPDGTGNEAGVEVVAFVQAFIQNNWALSPYLLDQSRLTKIEATATLTYTTEGTLVGYRINSPSGNSQFDDSLKKAIIKSQQLPQPLPQNLELVVTFNLKEMAEMRR